MLGVVHVVCICKRDRGCGQTCEGVPSQASSRQFMCVGRPRLQGAMEGWAGFAQDMRQYYGVDMSCLNEEYRREQQEYFLETSAWADVHPSQLLGPPACFMRYDLLKVTLEELAAPLKARASLSRSRAMCDRAARVAPCAATCLQ